MMPRARPWLGAVPEITIADAPDDAGLHLAFGRAFDGIAAVYGLMSVHDPDSDVSRINRAAPGAVLDIDPRSAIVLSAALALARQSDGLFNLFSAPRPVEWAYLPAQDWNAPSALALEGCRLMKRVPALIALGDIAKGDAVAAAVTAQPDCGIVSACVNGGGDLRVIGPDAWLVRLCDPRHPTATAYATMLLNAADHPSTLLVIIATFFAERVIQVIPPIIRIEQLRGSGLTRGV